MTKWRVFRAEEWKWHAVPESMERALAEDSIARGHPPDVSEPAEELLIDLPGMICTTRSIQEFDLDGLMLKIPSTDLKVFDRELRTVKERKFKDGTRYYKIHGYMACVVMTPEQRDALLKQFAGRVSEAEELRKVEDATLAGALQNARARGVRVMSYREERHKNDLVDGKPLSGLPNEEKN